MFIEVVEFTMLENYKNEDWLREQYVDKNKSTNEIAKETNVSYASISRWLHKFDIRTGERDRYKYICPECNVPYKNPSMHFTQSECKRPGLSDIQIEMLKGLAMGDGSIDFRPKNWAIRWGSINKEFMEWFNWRMEDIGVEVRDTEKNIEEAKGGFDSFYSEEYINKMNYHKFYVWSTITHPKINKIFENWVVDGVKRFPEKMKLNPINLCIWYCGDGGLNWSNDKCHSTSITTINESERIDNIVSSFKEIGLNPKIYQKDRKGSFDNPHTYTSINFNGEELERFLEYIGPAPPGMEYKWEIEDRENYNKLLKSSKTKLLD